MIEIKELSIKVNIESSHTNNNTNANQQGHQSQNITRAQMDDYLEQVIMILKNKKER